MGRALSWRRLAPPAYVPNYPAYLVQSVTLRDGSSIVIRPIRPEDALIEQAFVRNLSEESRYYRFMDAIRELSPQMLAHFTHVDYERHMALIAVTGDGAGEAQVGVARYIATQAPRTCEFAIVVADAWQHRGVGAALMRILIGAAREHGFALMFGEVLASNHAMLSFTRRLGFREVQDATDPRVTRVELRIF
jgi:acetyltransferase